ncbi:MAG TPA: hypothetical protein VMB35_10160 [Methanomicrobiales archaeon]|nr:hypothetical protein [Methanomicrobiales archaeon]
MFIGHFAVAYILIALFPQVPVLVPLIGVSFPDLLWPFLILAGVEKVRIDPGTPLQRDIVFERYPYSHSLLVGTLVSGIPGVALGLLVSPLAGFVFVIASASHWVLDTVVHLRDLPLLGFGRDHTVGLGLWRRGGVTFAVELVVYAVVTLLVLPARLSLPLLVLGIAFHLVNANSFFGFTKKNPASSPRAYALLALFGFLGFILVAFGIFAIQGAA